VVSIDRCPFKDVPLDLRLNCSKPPSYKKHKTVKHYLIGIICDHLVDFKRWGKSVVAALESKYFFVIAVSETRNL
jgi:hypothetical protein